MYWSFIVNEFVLLDPFVNEPIDDDLQFVVSKPLCANDGEQVVPL